MLDPLVYREDRNVTRPGETAVLEDLLEVTEHRRRTVGPGVDPVHKVRARKVESLLGDPLAFVTEERSGIPPEEVLDGVDCAHILSFAQLSRDARFLRSRIFSRSFSTSALAGAR